MQFEDSKKINPESEEAEEVLEENGVGDKYKEVRKDFAKDMKDLLDSLIEED